MADEHALLAAIAANPDDDTVRLAYADWLDDAGGEANHARAEYIRIQIRRQHWPAEPTDSARESRLYVTYCHAWRREIPGFTIALDYRRGFPCRASATASAVLAAADNPLARIIEELAVYLDTPVTWQTVLRDQLLSGLRRLTVVLGDPNVTWAWWNTRFFSEFAFPRLESLRLYALGLGDAGAGWLCGVTGFPSLRELDLSHNAIGDGVVDSLSIAPITSRLRRLRLTGNGFSPEGVRRLTDRFGPVLDLG